MMSELTERQKLILALVIRDYIETAHPVGSNYLVKRYHLNISPATVRNEMATLNEAGFLRQPHTSAGRIPTEEGYRYFVGRLMGQPELPTQTQRTITHQFYQARQDIEHWMHLAASVLAAQSQAASLVTSPHPTQLRLKHLEMIATRGRQVLMILVLSGGEVRQQILTLTEPIAQSQLSQISRQITDLGKNLDMHELSNLAVHLKPDGQDILKMVCIEIARPDTLLGSNMYRDGLTNVLAKPEFAESENAQRALRVFEERSFLEDLFSSTVLSPEMSSVQVLIGGEDTWDELRDFSMVVARYGAPGLVTGTLGVLGPIRMAYGRTISTVRFVAELLSNLVTETLVD